MFGQFFLNVATDWDLRNFGEGEFLDLSDAFGVTGDELADG